MTAQCASPQLRWALLHPLPGTRSQSRWAAMQLNRLDVGVLRARPLQDVCLSAAEDPVQAAGI